MSKKRGLPIHGWINLYKPLNMTSSQAVGRVKWLLNASKVGHGGTLDPLATGVLPLALGQATKTMQFSLDADKTYAFTITFGEQRTTDDAEGEVLRESQNRPNEAEVLSLLPTFTGEIEQVPPIFSALKIGGQAAYARARAGEMVDMEAKKRNVTIHEFNMTAFTRETASFTARVSKGTYIRSLARDIGAALGCYGYISKLHRVQAGVFTEENAVTVEEIEAFVEAYYMNGEDKRLDNEGKTPDIPFLLPVETILADIPEYVATGAEVRLLKQGRTFKRVHVAPGLYRVMTMQGNMVSLVRFDDAGLLHIERNFG